ncbi:MAG: hypothetical protein WBD16_08105 [Pyrinomonadaceae bacterium]
MFDGPENFEGEMKIAEALASLRRVDAPGDFDAHVRARIARGRGGEGASAWVANSIRIGVPIAAAIVIALGGYFVSTTINTGQNDVPAVAESRSEPQNPIVEQPSSNIEITQSPNRTTIKSDELVAENNRPVPTSDIVKPNGPNSTDSETSKDRPTGGSAELAVRESKNIYPRGLNPNAKVPANAKGVGPNTRIHVSSILEFIGVKATWAGDGWRVDSVDVDNIANRSGIRTGDVVEAINDQSVDKTTTFPAKFDGKSVRVRRDGASRTIEFKP